MEKIPIEPDNFENEEKTNPDILHSRIGLLSRKLRILKDKVGLIDREILESQEKSFEDKVHRYINKSIKILALMGSLLYVSKELINQEMLNLRAENTIEELNEQPGTFVHTDPETTHIINYLTGKDTISEQEIKKAVKGYISQQISSSGFEEPQDYDSLNIIDAGNYLIELNSKKYGIKFEKIMNEDEYLKTLDIPRYFQWNPNVYTALWKLMKENGSPKVKFSETNTKLKDTTIAKYRPANHTIYIRLVTDSDMQNREALLEELAHSRQYMNDPADVLVKSMLEKSNPNRYSDLGTNEFEAHKIISPQLKERFKKISGEDIK